MEALPPGWVQIDFEQGTPYGVFRDALVFPEGEVPPLDVLEAMKAERVNNWVNAITASEELPPDGGNNG